MKYKKNWEETKEKWAGYWKQKNQGRPLMNVIVRRPEIEEFSGKRPVQGTIKDVHCQGKYYNLPEHLKYTDMNDKYFTAERMVERYRQFCDTHAFLGESFPNLDVDFGPGAMASYLGAEICFQEDTVWYKSCIEEWEDADDFLFRPNSKWFRQHLNLVKQCKELANGDFLIPMPDIMENIDVIASLRGAQNTLFDLVDEPELIKNRITQITNIYYDYFNQFYEEIKEEEGGNAYAVFQIWGPGRTVKLQCDFSAMLSPDNFREFIQESLRVQAQKADCVLYHLDGSDAIRHLDSLMEIEEIDALQWSSGDTAPDGTMEEWDEIYDKVRKAGKSLWIKVYTGEFEDWIKNAERIVKKYGSAGLFFDFPEMSMEQGKTLLSYAESNWSNIAGTFDIEVK